MPIGETSTGFLWFILPAWETKPQYIHGRRGFDRLKACQFAHARKTTICANRQSRSYLVPAILSAILHAMHVAILLDQLFYSRAHNQRKVGVAFRFSCEELQETRLGNHGDVVKARFQCL